MGTPTASGSLSRRSFLSAAGLAGLSVPLVAACGSSGPGDSGGGGKTLQVWVLQDEAQNPIQQSAIDRFNKSSGTKLKLVPFAASGSSGYTDKLRVGMGSPQAPDIIFNWGSGSILDYVRRGQLMDLTQKLQADAAWKNSFLPAVLGAGAIDGRYYGIPLRGMQPVLLFYNKTMFAEQGQQPPKTYADLLRLVDFFKGKGIQPIALGAVDQWPSLMWLEYLARPPCTSWAPGSTPTSSTGIPSSPRRTWASPRSPEWTGARATRPPWSATPPTTSPSTPRRPTPTQPSPSSRRR
jgi:xylobiose transport system substrate-binding protein